MGLYELDSESIRVSVRRLPPPPDARGYEETMATLRARYPGPWEEDREPTALDEIAEARATDDRSRRDRANLRAGMQRRLREMSAAGVGAVYVPGRGWVWPEDIRAEMDREARTVRAVLDAGDAVQHG